MRRLWTFVFWVTTLASVVPLLVTRFLPFADLPEHVAAIGTVARLICGETTADPYVVDLVRSQYFLYHALGGALAVVTRDAIVANQILLAIVALLWPLSLRSLLRATRRDDRFAIFGTMVFYNRALAIGFLPYLASVPIAIVALAIVARWCRRPTWRRTLAFARGRGDGRTKWPLAIAAVASLVTTVNTTFEARRASREMLGDFDDLLATMEPGKRVVMMNYDRRSPRTHFWPYVFAGSYHRALHGGVSSWSFTELPHWPLHYAPGEAPPRHRPFWIFNPHAFRSAVDGAYYDYALVQGDTDRFASSDGVEGFVEVAHSGRFTLFAKTKAVSAPPPYL